MRRVYPLVLAFVTMMVLSWTAVATNPVQLFPLEELRPGMKGTALTVIEGTTIESFDVEVIGILEGGGPVSSLVLVQVAGDVIDRAGGIAAGMSGSPVYIDGKLLGAVGYGYEMTDHRLALVTPAREMFALMDELRIEEPLKPTLPLPDWPIDAVRPIRTPVIVSGSAGRSLQRLREALANYDVEAVPLAGRAEGLGEKVPLQPGSAVGVQLVRGDMNVTAIGTVTAVHEDGRFVAFGHPFLHRGIVDYWATSAEIVRTVSSSRFPFKLANPGPAIGTIGRDRGAGIAGQLGTTPQTVSLEVKVFDVDRGREHQFSVEVVDDELLAAPLLLAAALEALDRAVDRVGPGTSWIDLRLKTKGDKWQLTRNNMYYSSGDVAAMSLADLATALRIFENNPFVDPQLEAIQLETRIDTSRRTAQIEKAVPVDEEVSVGDGVHVRVTLRPYRSEPFEELVWLPIPQQVGTGTITVLVQGGEYFFGPFIGDEQEDTLDSEQEIANLEHLIEEFERQPKNNELILEFYPSEELSEASEDEERVDDETSLESGDYETMDSSQSRYNMTKPIRTVHPTGYVVRGETTFTLELIGPGEKEPPF